MNEKVNWVAKLGYLSQKVKKSLNVYYKNIKNRN